MQKLNLPIKIVPKIVFFSTKVFFRLMLSKKVRKCQPWHFCGVKLTRKLTFWGKFSPENFLITWVQPSFKILCFVKLSTQYLTISRIFDSDMTRCRNAASDSKESKKSWLKIWHVETPCFKNWRVVSKLIQNLNLLKKNCFKNCFLFNKLLHQNHAFQKSTYGNASLDVFME